MTVRMCTKDTSEDSAADNHSAEEAAALLLSTPFKSALFFLVDTAILLKYHRYRTIAAKLTGLPFLHHTSSRPQTGGASSLASTLPLRC